MAAQLDLRQLCTDVVAVAREAGNLIRGAQHFNRGQNYQRSSAQEKKNTADIVTETDQASETLIRTRLGTLYKDVLFIGEESFKAGLDTITNQPTFIVDPIDGTSNFVHGLPEVCVSIALVIDRQPAVGVVYNPFTDELWSAVRGDGAYYSTCCNSDAATSSEDDAQSQRLPLFPAPLPENGLRGACIGIEFGSDRQGPNFELNLQVFQTLAYTQEAGGRFVNSLRCIGSAALAICRVASGQQEAFWECGCWAWDVAAAWCILNEAGGIMVDGHPGGWTPEIDNRRYLAVRPGAVSSGLGGESEGKSARQQQEDFVNEFWSCMGDLRSTYGPPGSA